MKIKMRKKLKKTILLTGGAGFIGSHLAKKLIELGYPTIIVDDFNSYYNPKLKEARIFQLLKSYDFKLYREDITNFVGLKKIFEENKIDIICHQAAQAGVRYSLINPFAYEKSNVKGTLNLLELAKDFKIKSFIFASSSSVYSGNTKLPFSEKDILRTPISIYGITKKAGEELVKLYHKLYKIPSTILRYFTVYGPWGRPDMAAFKFTQAILKNEPIEVYNFGKMKRNFTYIDDIVDGTVSAIKKNYPFEIFNLGNSRSVPLNYFIELIEKNLGKKAEKKLLPMQPGDIPENPPDISKAKKMLRFQPQTDIEEGIKRFIKWYIAYYEKSLNFYCHSGQK